jgi:hypothetical protein
MPPFNRTHEFVPYDSAEYNLGYERGFESAKKLLLQRMTDIIKELKKETAFKEFTATTTDTSLLNK